MTLSILNCSGGSVELPPLDMVLIDRLDGGCVVVSPPREVWERSELSAEELHGWSSLVAAVGRAMLDVLPQLDGGCVNYWEAGNWALNHASIPVGPKSPLLHRRVHLHVIGRSRWAKSDSWKWGEAPYFPSYASRSNWAGSHLRLTPEETASLCDRIAAILIQKYGFSQEALTPALACEFCSYPFAGHVSQEGRLCPECAP